ncbi:MAG TPA: class II fructose-bisphosphate aldolase, partial [Marisediminicola sp.]|nr:class II fructose-bisphosphate aldolase [Marisediminicola sp.]
AGRNPIFQSHMWDGSAVPLEENLEIAKTILPRMKAINAILEVEIGVVGGEEDGVSHDINEHLYTTLDDAIATVEALGLGENGRYMAALTFGNVHGVYKPGNVKLRPELLGEIQAGIQKKYGTGTNPLDLVFHGGSGSTDEEIATAVRNGVVKMNIDTDTQYAFSRSIADTVLKNYDGFLKIDGEVGNKKIYDPRSWGKIAEKAMAARVVDATRQLGSAGHSGS